MRSPWIAAFSLSLLLGCGQASLPQLPGKLAFVSDRFEPTRGIGLTARGVCVLENGRIRKLLQMAEFPRWSHDGKKLYCDKIGGGIVILSYPEGKVVREFKLLHSHSYFALLPDESGLVYAGWDTSYTAAGKEVRTLENLYEYDFATGKGRQLTQITSPGHPSLTHVDISPDGLWIVFDRSHSGTNRPDPERGIYLLNRATGQLRKLFEGRNARFTPDGRVIFVTHFLNGEHMKTAEVFIYDPKTEETKRVTKNGENDLEYSPIMSPDGHQIAYEIRVFAGGDKASGLYVINADGTNEHRILGHDGHVYLTPDWGP